LHILSFLWMSSCLFKFGSWINVVSHVWHINACSLVCISLCECKFDFKASQWIFIRILTYESTFTCVHYHYKHDFEALINILSQIKLVNWRSTVCLSWGPVYDSFTFCYPQQGPQNNCLYEIVTILKILKLTFLQFIFCYNIAFKLIWFSLRRGGY